LKSELKSKSRRRRHVVEKSQSESTCKTVDAIDVGHYSVGFTDFMVDKKWNNATLLHCW